MSTFTDENKDSIAINEPGNNRLQTVRNCACTCNVLSTDLEGLDWILQMPRQSKMKARLNVINLLTSEDELTRFLKMFYYRRWMSILLVIHIKKINIKCRPSSTG